MLDGGRQLQVRREAQAAASAASRAAVQLSVQEVYGGGLDAALARARAGAELGSRDATGAVAVDGQTVTVTVTDSVDYYLLPGDGIRVGRGELGALQRRADRERRSMRRNVVGAVGALLATLALVVGVPVMLVLLVGNPWPGRARVEMRDEVAVVVGVLAVVAWLLWARFVVAIAVEARSATGGAAHLRTSVTRAAASP